MDLGRHDFRIRADYNCTSQQTEDRELGAFGAQDSMDSMTGCLLSRNPQHYECVGSERKRWSKGRSLAC